MSTKKQDRIQRRNRVIALAIAGVMIVSILAAAVLSQVW